MPEFEKQEQEKLSKYIKGGKIKIIRKNKPQNFNINNNNKNNNKFNFDFDLDEEILQQKSLDTSGLLKKVETENLKKSDTQENLFDNFKIKTITMDLDTDLQQNASLENISEEAERLSIRYSRNLEGWINGNY